MRDGGMGWLALLGGLCVAPGCVDTESPDAEALAPHTPSSREPVPAPVPEPAPKPVEEPEPELVVDPAMTGLYRNFPIWERVSMVDGRSTPVSAGQLVVDVAVHPSGSHAVVLTRDTDRDNVQWHRWDFASPLVDLAGPPLDDVSVREILFDPLDASLVAVVQAGSMHAMVRCPSVSTGPCVSLLETEGRLGDLRVPLARWNGHSRAFATLEEDGLQRVVSVRTDGSGAYDVTHPEGRLTDLTDPALLQRVGADEWDNQPPKVLRVASARLLDIDPASGDALFAQDGQVHRLPWDADTRNWRAMSAPEPALRMEETAEVRIGPNGRMRWSRAGDRLRLVDRDGTVWTEMSLAGAPALVDFSPTGDCGVFVDGATLSTHCIDHPAARVRHLDSADRAGVPALMETGLAYRTPSSGRLFEVYETLQYADIDQPTFASVDGMLTVLHAAMQAVFIQREVQAATPALTTFLEALKGAAPSPRVALVAEVALHVLSAGLDRPSDRPDVEAELARIRAVADARSPLYDKRIAYDDYKPRGPYTTSTELRAYFQAFKVTVNLVLNDEERAALTTQSAVVEAWAGWQSASAPFRMGSRQEPVFGDAQLPSHVRVGCIPLGKPRMFALAWGPDSEVLERLTAHDQMPPECGVAFRQIPSGLDLLAALGDDDARAIALTSPEGRFAGYVEALEAVSARRLEGDGVSGAWLEVVRAVATAADVPRDVDPVVWHRRRMESALSTWVDLRHLLVLVTERGAAQAGGGGEGWFEELSTEPAHGVVDPMPRAWARIADAATALAALVDPAVDTELHDLVSDVATLSGDLGSMARDQMDGKPLTSDQYDLLDWYVRSVEWPIMKFSAYAADETLRGRIPSPPSEARIVDVHSVSPPGEARRYFHIAKGLPRPVTMLLVDRGVSVPARGAVSSYYEVVSERILDDDEWRKMVESTDRPHWLNPNP